jgi:hypothetical protein
MKDGEHLSLQLVGKVSVSISLPVRSCAKQVISGTIEFIIRQIYVFYRGMKKLSQ